MSKHSQSNQVVIHTEASLGWGGQEIRTLTECRWFHRQGWKVILLCREHSKIKKHFEDAGLQTITVTFTKASQFADLLLCKKILTEHQPAVVGTHSNIDSRVALAAAAWAGIPIRIRYRHVSIPVRSNFWNKVIYRKFATHVITTGDCISKPLIKKLKLRPNKVHTIHTGIEPPETLPDRESARLSLCQKLQLPSDTRFIGQISVLRAWKGQGDVIKAFESIAEQFPGYHLLLVGGGHGEEYLPPLANKTSCHERIHFLGHQPDPWPYFRAMDINILASTSGEGIPQVGMQSMLSKTAFVGTRVGGIPEIITHEQSGLLVDPNSPKQIALALQRLLNDPVLYQSLVERAHDWATTHTTVETMARKTLQLLS